MAVFYLVAYGGKCLVPKSPFEILGFLWGQFFLKDTVSAAYRSAKNRYMQLHISNIICRETSGDLDRLEFYVSHYHVVLLKFHRRRSSP